MRNISSFVHVSVLAATAALTFACATSEDVAAETATLTQFCHARAAAECTTQIVKSCGAKDMSTCISQREDACNKSAPQGTVYVPSAGPACLTAVTSAYATATLTADALDNVDTQCEPIFSGPGPARTPCTTDYDCSTIDGLRCLYPFGADTTTTQGKCLAPNVVAPAAPCPGEADVCPDGYFCNTQGKVCTALSGVGEACSPGYQPCVKGSTCPGIGIFNATCQSLKASGDACLADTDCASSLCDKATGQSQGVCADQIQLTELDSMCAQYQ